MDFLGAALGISTCITILMVSSTNFQAPTHVAYFPWSCDKVYHKQEERFLLYILSQIVTWQYIPNPLD